MRPPAAASAALFLVAVVTRSELPGAMTAGVVVLAVGGIPRTSVMRLIATSDGLTVVGDGVPLHYGQHFVADDVQGVFVRALARSERPEERRLELVLLERHGRCQSLLRNIDDPKTLSWIATQIDRALGFEATPGPPERLGPGSSPVH